jgi:ATP-dependent Clp protease, protease subunit
MTKDTPLIETAQDQIEKTLLKARRVFLSEAVTSESADDIIRKLWYLDLTAPGEMITLVINSPGGSIDSGMAIWDQLKMMNSPVTTLVTGLAASMGSVLMLAAAPKRRLATPNARVMIHQPSIHGDFVAPAVDIDIQAREILRTRDRLAQLYAEATGQSVDKIKLALDRDKWFTASEALSFGLIDRIVANHKEAFAS